MGTWGTGAFDNDMAADFVTEVIEDGPAALQEAFEVALDPDLDFLDADEAVRAIAAAESLLAALSKDTQYIPDAELADYLLSQDSADLASLKPLAVAALTRTLAPDSEILDLWEDSADARAWRTGVARLSLGLDA